MRKSNRPIAFSRGTHHDQETITCWTANIRGNKTVLATDGSGFMLLTWVGVMLDGINVLILKKGSQEHFIDDVVHGGP